MKRILTGIAFMLLNQIMVSGQTAVDFTATDCTGANRSLFTELDAGKVIVLVWVMPCATCISDAKAGYDAVAGFATTHPGKVIYWLADDEGNNTCSALSAWASANSIGPAGMTYFDNAGNVIDQNNFGGYGMPHVAVLGGSDHHIYYSELNGSNNGTAITNAITTAINATSGIGNVSNSAGALSLFPNPAKDKISISYSLAYPANVNIEVCDAVGKNVQILTLGGQYSGPHSLELDLDHKLSAGIYFVKLVAGNDRQAAKFTIVD